MSIAQHWQRSLAEKRLQAILWPWPGRGFTVRLRHSSRWSCGTGCRASVIRNASRRHILSFAAAATLPSAAGSVAVADSGKSQQQRSAKKSFAYALPGDRLFPEGIAVTRNQRHFFVTSTTDGAILRGRVNGRAARVFLPAGEDGRTTAVGIKTRGDRLYIAGGTTGAVFVTTSPAASWFAESTSAVGSSTT